MVRVLLPLVSILGLLLGSCGPPAATSPRSPSGATPPPLPPARTQPTSQDLRQLSRDASFADLVTTVRQLAETEGLDSEHGCLLSSSHYLAADLAPAIRPLPDAPDNLIREVENDPGAVNVLTRWGAYGTGRPTQLSFVALNLTLPPRREPAVVWIVTAGGVYVRQSQEGSSPTERISANQAAAMLADPGALFLSASANLPLDVLLETMSAIPSQLNGRVGLAVALARGTRLPAPPAPTADGPDAYCPDGISPLPEDANWGDLQRAEVMTSLHTLRARAEHCVSTSTGNGAGGGRLQMAIRINPRGVAEEACATSDEANDPLLRHCVSRAIRMTPFPMPRPSGFVDLALPLNLRPARTHVRPPVCTVPPQETASR